MVAIRSVLGVRLRRRAMTLIEMMVAVGVTLILLFAILKLAQLIGSASESGRAILELSGEVRAAANRLQYDLDRVSCRNLPWVNSSAGPGYFEYIEGPAKDGIESLFTDADDVLAFTAYSPEQPFTGRVPGPGGTITATSEYAEIIYWCTAEADGALRLRRRVLLVDPNRSLQGVATPSDALQNYDISFSSRNGQLVANSIVDLSRREYRTLHQAGGGFPFVADLRALLPYAPGGPLGGEDVVLGRCLGMDVRAYDPQAPISPGPVAALVPGDPGYSIATASSNPIGRGAYVDLNYAGNSSYSWFSGPPMPKAGENWGGVTAYDFWTSHYENDGIDQDGVYGADQGVDGFDNDGANGVDDPTERETTPPYPYPLRGIKVTLRGYDTSSRQVRQASVVSDFVPN